MTLFNAVTDRVVGLVMTGSKVALVAAVAGHTRGVLVGWAIALAGCVLAVGRVPAVQRWWSL